MYVPMNLRARTSASETQQVDMRKAWNDWLSLVVDILEDFKVALNGSMDMMSCWNSGSH